MKRGTFLPMVARCGVAASAILVAVGIRFADASSAKEKFFRLQSEATLTGPVDGWDYMAFEATRGYLFIDRRAQGVTVFDTRRDRVVAQISGAAGSNATVLVPAFDRGFTANRDGTTTMFRLSSLTTLKRTRFGNSADAGFYESATHQVMFTMGDDHALAFLDARTGKFLSILKMPSTELEAAAADGKGDLFVNERDRDRIARVDARTHSVTAEWDTGACHQPVGMAYDAEDRRILSGCRGDHPVLLVMDADTGRILATPQIGRGNDTVIFNSRDRLVYTSNGIDSNIVVLRQTDDDKYALYQAIMTRPGARTMAFDPVTGRLFLVTAQGAVDPAKKINTAVAPFYPNIYFPGTLTVLTYAKAIATAVR